MALLRSLERRSYRREQRGAALIVGLIMLLLLTLIGVAGMRDTLLQEKMVASMRDRDMALQAAESALRAAEVALSQSSEPALSGNTNGLYDLSASCTSPYTQGTTARVISGTPVSEQTFWQKGWAWGTAANAVVYTKTLQGVPFPKYVIEKLPQCLTDLSKYPTSSSGTTVQAVDEDSPCEGSSCSQVKPDYRVTARGEGMSPDTVVILQSTFRRTTL